MRIITYVLSTLRKGIKKMSEIKRKEAREHAVQLLFEVEFKTDESIEEIYELSVDNREIPNDEYIRRVYFGVYENKDKIDELIGSSSNGWKTHRLTKLSRSVMRVCVYEMLFEEIPYSVSINEAVELTKKFDDPKARAFVNGVLNGIKDRLEKNDNQGGDNE